tara:strand:- start:356 stop:787 length:432 start_codon:yes stop_codon:yes gene_type:complete
LIKHITELEALEFVSQQEHKDEWHKDFHMWKKHLIVLANNWPQLKQFYRGAGKWLGFFDTELKGVYWYNISSDEIYDGYLISSKPGIGIKLGRYLDSNIAWKNNWSLCDKKYLKFNKRLGFEVKDTGKINDREVFLLWRQKKY